VFNVLFVIGMCSLLSKELLTLTWWPLFRDSLYYSFGLVTLAVFVGVISPGEIELWEAIVLFVMYFGYIVIMYYNRKIYTAITGKQLNMPGSSALASVVSTSGGRPLSTRNLDRTGSVSSIVTTEMGPVSFRWPGTFRAGVLKLLRDPDSWIDTAGVGIVAKLAGDVDYVFKQVDINGDNEIDRDELFKLFEKLDCRVAPEELDAVFRELDADKDGTVRESTSKSL
jgi:Ca2+/Na+ antiporter